MVPIAMRWRHVLFENYPVAPATVAARLPDALAVDTFDGQAWLSVVPFVNADVRPRGLPAALGLELPELNLRTYVDTGTSTLFGANGFETPDSEPVVYYGAEIEVTATASRRWRGETSS